MNLPNIAEIETRDPKLAELLKALNNGIENAATAAGVATQGNHPTPATVSAVNVTSGNGVMDVAIHDNSQVTKAINYIVEWDTSPAFTQPRVEHPGVSRNIRIPVGASQGPFYVRAYSQYPGSDPSTPVNFGGKNPTPILTTMGTDAALQPSNGSGTASTDGQQGGKGFGTVFQRQSPRI